MIASIVEELDVVKVLLVEDNPGDVRFFEILLRQITTPKFKVFTVDTLAQGLDTLVKEDIDVVMLDLSLPDSFGLDTVGRVKQLVDVVPIIVLTGNDDDEFALKALNAGAQDYLVKGNIDEVILGRAIRYAIERNRQEVELRSFNAMIQASQKRFELLVNQNKSGIVVMDSDDVIRFVNPAAEKLFGRKMDELIGTVPNIPEELNQNIFYEIAETKRQVEVSSTDIVWAGQLSKLITLHDITDLKRAEQAVHDKNIELSKINKSLDRFVYIISHDLKKPAANIIGLVSLLMNEIKAEEGTRTRGIMDKLGNSTTQLRNMIDALLEASRNTQDPTSFELINMNSLMKEIIGSMDLYIEDKEAMIAYDFSRNPVIFYNLNDLKSIISNLLSNAIKYSKPEEPPIINMTTDKTGLGNSFTIRDNGVGIDLEKNRHKLFQKGERFNTEVEDGTGLGLWIVREKLEKYNSRIEVDSILNEGTTFTIYF